tara:strand:+ start:151 stop:324 length:174 start_codon:yes stop_codon:yes gene_type:complete
LSLEEAVVEMIMPVEPEQVVIEALFQVELKLNLKAEQHTTLQLVTEADKWHSVTTQF